MDPANEIMGGRAKDILWELIPFMPKPTSDFYSEALFRCKTHSQLDKALGGLKEILCVCFGLFGGQCGDKGRKQEGSEKKN